MNMAAMSSKGRPDLAAHCCLILLCWDTSHLITTDAWVVSNPHENTLLTNPIATAALCHATALICSSTVNTIPKLNRFAQNKQASCSYGISLFSLTIGYNSCMDLQ